MITRRFALSLIGAIIALPTFAEDAVFNTDDIAINGYDPVAYFEQGQPVEGLLDYAVNWNDAVWLFSTPEHMALFEGNPEAYAPQFGGYCAFALSKGQLAPTVPEAWTIVDGKLYLNYNLQARQLWSEDIPGNITKAESYWPDILQ